MKKFNKNMTDDEFLKELHLLINDDTFKSLDDTFKGGWIGFKNAIIKYFTENN